MASRKPAKPASARSQPARLPITLERTAALCPTANIATAIADTFGLDPVDFDGIMSTTDTQLRASAEILADTLHERQLFIHCQRITGAFVASAFGAAQFYSEKVSEARGLTSRLANDARDEDRDGAVGFDSKAERARLFAAQAGLQAFALLAAAQGAAAAFLHVTGEHWKPYVAPVDNTHTVARKAADLELGAFG
jgi:hypothetical protein